MQRNLLSFRSELLCTPWSCGLYVRARRWTQFQFDVDSSWTETIYSPCSRQKVWGFFSGASRQSRAATVEVDAGIVLKWLHASRLKKPRDVAAKLKLLACSLSGLDEWRVIIMSVRFRCRSCTEPFYLCFQKFCNFSNTSPSSIVVQENSAKLFCSRNVLLAAKLHLTFHQYGVELVINYLTNYQLRYPSNQKMRGWKSFLDSWSLLDAL